MGTRVYALGIPSAVLYTFGVPLLGVGILLRLKQNRRLYRSKKVDYEAHVYKFLYGGYTRSHYYWEAVIMIRKVLLSIIYVLFKPLGAESQGLVAFGILHLASLYHTNARPYDDPLLNKIESRALSLMTALLFVGLFLFRVEVELVQIVVTALMFAMLIVAVIAFIFSLSYVMYDDYRGNAKARAQHAREAFTRRIRKSRLRKTSKIAERFSYAG